MVDQDAPHLSRRHGEEVGLSLPTDPAGVDQPQVGLMHQIRGLKRVAGSFPAQVAFGELPQLTIDLRQQLGSRFPVPGSVRLEGLGRIHRLFHAILGAGGG